MGMTSLNISLPQELKNYIEQQTQQGYSTPSEYVRELIREDQKRRAKEKLDALLMEGLNSGPPLAADAQFWEELRKEARARLAARKKKAKR
jgi:antitoxin ParD1/3/4